MKFTKIITTLTKEQLLRDLLDQDLPIEYRNACRDQYFKLAELFYNIHILSNYTLIALISLHIFAVIIHKGVFKENLLKRIL